jgi:hypothetical protein
MKRVLIIAGAPFGSLDRSASEVSNSIATYHDADDVITVGAIELAAASWSHRAVDSAHGHGHSNTTVRLKDGTLIDTDEFGAVLNLVRSLPVTGFARASHLDRAHSQQQALFVGLLRSFNCRVINGVDGDGRLGVHSPLRWSTLARRCGIDTSVEGVTTGTRLLAQRAMSTSISTTNSGGRLSASSVTVVGDRVFGAQSPMHARQCRRLARAAGCELLGLQFSDGLRRQLLAADPFPALCGHVAEAVARLLCERATAASERVA